MAKKIFAVWLMLFILFSGCKAEVLPEEPINEDIPKEEQNAENPPLDEQNPEEKFITEKIIGLDGTEKFIIRDFEGNQIGYEYSLIEPAQEWDLDIYSYRGKVTEGTMLIIEYDENGEPSLAKVPAERYYLLDENGYPVADTAFEVYECQSNNYSSDIYSWIAGVSEGIRYAYEIIDGEAILVEKAEPHKTECECGFIHTSYCFDWYGGYFKHGLNIGDEVFLEPVYSGIYVPFNNTERVVIYYGSYMQGADCGYAKIIDKDKKVLSEKFNRIQYYELDNGYYVGIGIARGENSEYALYDEKGAPMKEGFWFIDMDGNIISQRIDFYIDDMYNNIIPEMTSVNDIITAIDENGNEIKLTIKDYAFKP